MIDACVNIAPTRDLDLKVSTIALLLFDRFNYQYIQFILNQGTDLKKLTSQIGFIF